jgi:ABC-2 type transport system permease protein
MTPSDGRPLARARHAPTASPEQTLRRLFLTVFLRGRSSRGLSKERAPKSVGGKLTRTLVFYGVFGLFALSFLHQPIFVLSVYLHATTFVFLGMFVAASAGEVLFNDDEADILLHRPVTPQALLRAKVGVLVQVSLWLAGAFNLAGFYVGLTASDGGWRFPVAHAISTAGEALLCTGCVVLIYQLCLRWFGRERLEGLMTTAQVLVAVALILAGQVLPRIIFGVDRVMTVGAQSWWIAFLPPAWFAGFDDALAGEGAGASWALAAAGLVVTTTVLWLAFGKLAGNYETGLRTFREALPIGPKQRLRGRRIRRLVDLPPLRWGLRDPVTRAAFLLTTAYLFRDRDVKLRVYPGLAPMLVFPVVFSAQAGAGIYNESGFAIAFSGFLLGMMPMLGLDLLRYSQHWRAADIFRAAPMPGPTLLAHGARRAVLWLSALSFSALLLPLAWLTRLDSSRVLLLLPGIITLPVYALIPCLGGNAVPLSQPTEESRSAMRGLTMMGATLSSLLMAGLAAWAWYRGWFKWLLLIETIVAAGLYAAMRAALATIRWRSVE